MTLRTKKWNHLFSVTSPNKRGWSTAAVRIPCVCWLLAVQGELIPGRIPCEWLQSWGLFIPWPHSSAKVYLPSLPILCAHSSPQEGPNKILSITAALSAESWLLPLPSFSQPLLSLTGGDFWYSRGWGLLEMDKSDSGVWGQVCAAKNVFIAKGNKLHSQI